MPPLSALAQADAREILTADGDTVVLNSPAGDIYTVACLSFRRGMTRDAEGLAVIGEASSLTLSLPELAAKGIADPETLKEKGWLATTGGQNFRLDACPIDYTLGVATLILKRSANA